MEHLEASRRDFEARALCLSQRVTEPRDPFRLDRRVACEQHRDDFFNELFRKVRLNVPPPLSHIIPLLTNTGWEWFRSSWTVEVPLGQSANEGH